MWIRRLMAVAAASLVGIAAAVVPSAPASAGIITCNNNKTLRTHGYDPANPKPVSVELGWTGPYYASARARPNITSIGTWERFNFCRYSEGWWHIYSVGAGRYLSVRDSPDAGLLQATATSVGSREQFRFSTGGCGSDGLSKIQNVWNGKYVSAELGWGHPHTGLLRARADVAGCWEAFTTQ